MKLATTMALVIALAVSASYPRLVTLGGDARLMLDDYVEMWAYPGVISDYQFATGQSDSPSAYEDGWFGLVKNFQGTTLGVTINHGDMIEVLYHPGAWGIIVGLDYDKATMVVESLEVTEKAMGFDVAWGTDVAFFGDYSDLALGFGYDKETESVGENPEVGESMFMAGGSVRGHQDGFINLFPVISAALTMTTEIDGDEDTEDGKITEIMFDLGAAHNHMVAPKTQIIVGIFGGVSSTSYGGDPYEGADGQMAITIPRITGGIEQQVGKWICLRAGATSDTEYWSQGDSNSFSTSFNTNFGIGLMWDNFTLDGTIGEEFLHDGPYMVGGTSNGFMGQLAATYTF